MGEDSYFSKIWSKIGAEMRILEAPAWYSIKTLEEIYVKGVRAYRSLKTTFLLGFHAEQNI